jgi:phosphatidate cytidylyltransferase
MFKTRLVTAIALLGLLYGVFVSGSALLARLVIDGFFVAAIWEAARLFKSRHPIIIAGLYLLIFECIKLTGFNNFEGFFPWLMGCALLIWLIRLLPCLLIGLPTLNEDGDGLNNSILGVSYYVAILVCFLAIYNLFYVSPVYLLSAMAIVWVADTGAYFSGKAFGKHKLAPSISPGKTWEGAIGGAIAALLLTAASTQLKSYQDTFAVQLQQHHGWSLLLLITLITVAVSIGGDLFESQLKRRAGMKDSSHLLPGHGGILDRVDALLPVIPIALLVDLWH